MQRTFKLQNFKKISGIWLMKAVEISENDRTTVINFIQVALNQTLPDSLFADTAPVKNLSLIYQKM